MDIQFDKNKFDKFLETLTWYFHEKTTPTGFFHTIGDMRDKIDSLNQTLRAADESSTKLTKALNRLTLWGVIVASAGVIVAALALGFEVYKYFNQK